MTFFVGCFLFPGERLFVVVVVVVDVLLLLWLLVLLVFDVDMLTQSSGPSIVASFVGNDTCVSLAAGRLSQAFRWSVPVETSLLRQYQGIPQWVFLMKSHAVSLYLELI